MTTTIFLGRDNRQRWQLINNDEVVQENAVTRATLTFPGHATEDGEIYCADTDGEGLALTDNATVVEADLGGAPLKPGAYEALLTVYDAVNVNGIAWARVLVEVSAWVVCEDDA